MDQKRVSENAELGSLARDSERIKLRASEDKTQLPAAPTSQKKLARPAAADNVMQAQVPGQKKYGVLPGGKLTFTLILIAVCLFGGSIQSERAGLLVWITDFAPGLTDPDSYILTRQDLVRSLVDAHKSAEAEEAYWRLIALSSKRYGEKDQRTAYLKLSLASLYLDMGKTKEAERLWREQLKLLDKPEPTAPKEITNTLLFLSKVYDDRIQDKDAARDLYLATLRFWPLAPGNDTISNTQSNLARIDEDQGRYADANENFKKAFAFTENWGDHQYNVYRLLHIGTTYMGMGKNDEARAYLQRAQRMARVVDPAENSSWLPGVEKALNRLGQLKGSR